MQDFFLNNYRNQVKETHSYNNWLERVHPFNGILCKGFLPEHKLLKGYTLEERKAHPGERYFFTDYFHLHNDETIRFAVTIRVFPSIEDVHEGLIDILSSCTASYLPTIEEKGINAGDVGFAGHGEEQTMVSFTRYNVLINIKSLGPKLSSVKDLAQFLDSQVIAFQKQLSNNPT